MGDVTSWSAGARRGAAMMLRQLGRGVQLRMPAPAAMGNVGEQLGAAAPTFQDVELSPVAFRTARPEEQAGEGARWEMLVPAVLVERIVGTLDATSAEAMFREAYGVVVDEVAMEIVSVSSSDSGGSPYVYRLGLRAPASTAL